MALKEFPLARLSAAFRLIINLDNPNGLCYSRTTSKSSRDIFIVSKEKTGATECVVIYSPAGAVTLKQGEVLEKFFGSEPVVIGDQRVFVKIFSQISSLLGEGRWVEIRIDVVSYLTMSKIKNQNSPIIGSSALFPLPRTKTNVFADYLDIENYEKHFTLHDDRFAIAPKTVAGSSYSIIIGSMWMTR